METNLLTIACPVAIITCIIFTIALVAFLRGLGRAAADTQRYLNRRR